MEFRSVSCVIGDAVSSGLRTMKAGDAETKRAFKCAHRCVDLIYELTKRCATLPQHGYRQHKLIGPSGSHENLVQASARI